MCVCVDGDTHCETLVHGQNITGQSHVHSDGLILLLNMFVTCIISNW